MIGESIIKSQRQLIEIDDNELRGKISGKEDNGSITLMKDWEIDEPQPQQILQRDFKLGSTKLDQVG